MRSVPVAVMQIGDVGVSVSLREMRVLVGVSAAGRSALGVLVRVVTIVVTVPVAVADGVVMVPMAVGLLSEQDQRKRHQRRRRELDREHGLAEQPPCEGHAPE